MSTSSDIAASSRPSTSDGQQPGPISLFDYHLKILTDSYLQFFHERKRIEEVYAESLTRLHVKAKAIDTFLEVRNEPSTTRTAWSEVRDNVEREAQTRQAFISTLTMDVLNPLAVLKETQERTRKRIKEDLKDSINAHTEYADNVLPKMKRNYLKKCQEVEDYKTAAATASQPLMSNTDNTALKSPTSPVMKPVVTSPQPLRPLDRRPSGGGQSRNRSPSSSTALSDLAHQGKRQLNQLMTFLDKNNTVKDGVGVRSDNALRTVRAKREAEEADKEYRKSVHWLETLRLHRVKIVEAGYKSLEMFVIESAKTVKQVLEKYTDNMMATTTTQTQLSQHARAAVDIVNPEKDASVIYSKISRSLASAMPKPQLYYNYDVGECNDLIFGVSLVDYATARGLGDTDTPRVVRICIREVDNRGLDVEGIYRVSGRHAVVQALQHKIERNEHTFKFNPFADDVYAVSGLLKLYLRELPEPLFKFPLQERIQHSEDLVDHKSNNFLVLRAKIRRLPPIHQATLKAVVEHLSRVAACREKNKMDAKNLAIVFGTVIFGEEELPKGGDLLSIQNYKDSLMEDLINNSSALFDEPPADQEAPLPPAPAGEAAVAFPLGSSHTKVTSVSVPPPSPRRAQDDFVPQLPSRPAKSIHPSSRANHLMSRQEGEIPSVPNRPETEEGITFPKIMSEVADEDEPRGRRRSVVHKPDSSLPSGNPSELSTDQEP